MQTEKERLYLNFLSNLFMWVRYATDDSELGKAKNLVALFLGFPDLEEIRVRAKLAGLSELIEDWIESATRMVAAVPLNDRIKPIDDFYFGLFEEVLTAIVNAQDAKRASGLAYTFHNIPDMLFIGMTEKQRTDEFELIVFRARWHGLSETWLQKTIHPEAKA